MSKLIRHCSHCNNVTPFEIVYQASPLKLWDQASEWSDKQKKWVYSIDIIEPFAYFVVKCSTCEHISLLGGFEIENPETVHNYPQLYPASPKLPDSVPEPVRETYFDAATIRVRAPNAFAGQIRKSLEFICKDKEATGANLQRKLNSLVEKKILPETLAEMTDLIRQIGNIGVHADDDKVSLADAELIDEFFKTIVEYVYVAPSKILRLKGMIASKKLSLDDIPF